MATQGKYPLLPFNKKDSCSFPWSKIIGVRRFYETPQFPGLLPFSVYPVAASGFCAKCAVFAELAGFGKIASAGNATTVTAFERRIPSQSFYAAEYGTASTGA